MARIFQWYFSLYHSGHWYLILGITDLFLDDDDWRPTHWDNGLYGLLADGAGPWRLWGCQH